VIGPEKPLCLTYGVALCDGKMSAKDIDALYKEWTEFSAK
jgi:hypothetical protein